MSPLTAPGTLRLALAALALGGVHVHAQLLIVPTWDATLLNAPNAQHYKDAFNYAASLISARWNNNVTIPVTVAIGGTGGSSATAFTTSYSYSELRAALASHSSLAATSLPLTDPFNGSKTYGLSVANARAIGLPIRTVSNGTEDLAGAIELEGNAGYTFNPANPFSGSFDFIGTALHEITEVMGRTRNDPNSLLPFDLYRFTAPGVRDVTGGPGIYFSTDNGVTNLKGFNGSGSGDAQDWDDSNPADAFNASGDSSIISGMTPVDYLTLEAIGYTSVTPVPEPQQTAIAMLLGAGLWVGWRRRQSSQAGRA